MSPRTEKQFEDIREERKEQIRKVALEVVFEEGFQYASISKIAKRAGISKGLLYNYYDSKEEMIREIITKGFDEIFSMLIPLDTGLNSKEQARNLISEIFKVLKANLHYWQLYFSVLIQPKVMLLVAEKFMLKMEPIVFAVRQYFVKKGSSDPETDTRMILAFLDGICFHYMLDPTNFPLDDIQKRLYKMI